MGFLPVVFSLLYLESYLGLSEETRSPNAGLRTGGIRNPSLAFRCTEARTSPKARRVAAPSVQPSGASSWPPARLGPGAAQGRWLGEGRMLSGPAEELPRLGVGGHTRFQRPLPQRHWPRAAPVHTHPGAGSFPPLRLFSPLEQRRRKGSCSLASPDAGGSCRRRRRGSRAQRSGYSGPAPKPGPAPRSLQDPGSPAPHPCCPSLALTSSRAALAPVRRAESLGSRVGAGGLMDRGRCLRVAVAGAARVLAGRNGSRSTSSRSCSPPSPPFPSPPPPPPPPGSPVRMPERGKSVLLPVSLCGYARRGAALTEAAAAAAAAPAASPPHSPRSRGGRGARVGSGLRARASGGGCTQAWRPPGLRAGPAEPGPGLELQLDPRRRGRRLRGGWRGRGTGTMLPSGSLRSGYRLL